MKKLFFCTVWLLLPCNEMLSMLVVLIWLVAIFLKIAEKALKERGVL